MTHTRSRNGLEIGQIRMPKRDSLPVRLLNSVKARPVFVCCVVFCCVVLCVQDLGAPPDRTAHTPQHTTTHHHTPPHTTTHHHTPPHTTTHHHTPPHTTTHHNTPQHTTTHLNSVCLCVCVCLFVFVWRGFWFHFRVGVSRFWFGHVRCPRDRPSPGPPQNFALVSFSRRKIRSCLLSLGVFSWNFGGVLKAGTLKCARLGSRVVV